MKEESQALQVARAAAGKAEELRFALEKVISTMDKTAAQERVKEVAKRKKEIEAQRKELTSPLEKVKKAIIAAFKPAESALESLEKSLKGRLIVIDREEKAAVEAARAALEKAKVEGRSQRTVARKQEALATVAVAASVDRTTIRRTEKVRITDAQAFVTWAVEVGALDMLAPNEAEITVQNIRWFETTIPGVEIYVQESVVTR